MQPSPTRDSPAPSHSAATPVAYGFALSGRRHPAPPAGVLARMGGPCLVTAAPASADTPSTLATIHAFHVMRPDLLQPRPRGTRFRSRYSRTVCRPPPINGPMLAVPHLVSPPRKEDRPWPPPPTRTLRT